MPCQGAITLLQMVLKCADIGHLAADLKTHQRWAYQLEEEFFQQVHPLTCSASIACRSQCCAVSCSCIGLWPKGFLLVACTMEIDWQSTACMCCLVCAYRQQHAAWLQSDSTDATLPWHQPPNAAVMQLAMIPYQGHLYLAHFVLQTEHFCQS